MGSTGSTGYKLLQVLHPSSPTMSIFLQVRQTRRYGRLCVLVSTNFGIEVTYRYNPERKSMKLTLIRKSMKLVLSELNNILFKNFTISGLLQLSER